jgi:hypothetical protein
VDRVLRNSSPAISVILYDSTGNPANPPGGAITADVKDSAGVAITGSPFAVTNPPLVAGVLTFTIPAAALDVLDLYAVTWNISDGSKRRTQFEVVGGFLFTEAELRAFDSELTDPPYTDERVRVARQVVEEVFEDPRVTGVAFRPRGRRARLNGTGTSDLVLPDPLPHAVPSASIDGVALTAGELADLVLYDHGTVARKTGLWTAGRRNVVILYEHGWAGRPAPINEAALKYARHVLARVAMGSDRATVQFTDIGAFRLSVAGRDGWTGLPEVDAVLKQFAWARARVGGLA